MIFYPVKPKLQETSMEREPKAYSRPNRVSAFPLRIEFPISMFRILEKIQPQVTVSNKFLKKIVVLLKNFTVTVKENPLTTQIIIKTKTKSNLPASKNL